MDFVLGTDWSAHQGARGVSDALIRKCHAGGVRFLLNRASLAQTYWDASLVSNVTRAEEKGWVTGGYHFLHHGNAAGQAESFTESMQRLPGGLTGRLAVVDVEWAGKNRTDWPRTSDVREFIAQFREFAPRHPIGIYTAEGYWTNAMIRNADGEELADYLWQARWIDPDPITNVTLPDRPPRAGFGGWGRSPLWQWGLLRVGTRGVDGDAFYGSLDELRAYGGWQWKPIPERKNYRLGYNAMLKDSCDLVNDAPVPDGPAGPAFPAGVQDAREDAIIRLERMVIPEP